MASDPDLEKSRFDLLLLRLQIVEAKIDLLLERQKLDNKPASSNEPVQASAVSAKPKSVDQVQSQPDSPSSVSSLLPQHENLFQIRLQRLKVGKLTDLLALGAKLLALPVALIGIYTAWHAIPQVFLEQQKARAQTEQALSEKRLADLKRSQINELGHSNISDENFVAEVRQIVLGRTSDTLTGIAIRLLVIYAAFKAVEILAGFLSLFWRWLMFGLAYTIEALQLLLTPRLPEIPTIFPNAQQIETLKNFQAPARFLVLSAYAVVTALVVWPAILYSCALLGHPDLPASVFAALSNLSPSSVAEAARESSRVFASQ